VRAARSDAVDMGLAFRQGDADDTGDAGRTEEGGLGRTVRISCRLPPDRARQTNDGGGVSGPGAGRPGDGSVGVGKVGSSGVGTVGSDGVGAFGSAGVGKVGS